MSNCNGILGMWKFMSTEFGEVSLKCQSGIVHKSRPGNVHPYVLICDE